MHLYGDFLVSVLWLLTSPNPKSTIIPCCCQGGFFQFPSLPPFPGAVTCPEITLDPYIPPCCF